MSKEIGLEELFKIYDKNIFNNAITSKIGNGLSIKATKMDPEVLRIVYDHEEKIWRVSITALSKERLVYLLKATTIYVAMGEWPPSMGLDPKTIEKLFLCVFDRYFGGAFKIDGKVFYSPKDIDSLEITTKYTNQNNSCYLDSILMLLKYMKGASSFLKGGTKDSDSFLKALSVSDDVCIDVMKFLHTKLPKMKRGNGIWNLFNVAEVYSEIANMFPALKIAVPYRITRSDGTYSFGKQDIDILMFSEYLTASAEKEILWKEIRSPLLTFYNGGNPRIMQPHKTGIEDIIIGGIGGKVGGIGGKVQHVNVEKIRKFSEILLDRYQLVGVITLVGIHPKKEGGTHYIAYFLGEDDRWYFYDDMSPSTPTIITSLPMEGVWEEKGGKMPSMYFYRSLGSETDMDFHSLPGMDIKVIHRLDGYDMVFVTVKDENKIYKLDSIEPKPTTKLSEEKRMWRLTPENTKMLLTTLKNIQL